MTRPTDFAPTLDAAHARIAAVRPAAYARTRNALDGAVTRLSPYVTHGFVSLPEVLAGVASRHRLDVQHKFVFELGWREYFHHVWQHRGDAILHSLHEGPLPEDAYTRELPADIRQACTGVPVIDQAVRTLYATGYLHNHARMWLASYVVHLRKVHWRTGADWMVGHLLDGDLASNHLSWQWVAGTGSHKPYLFNADNVARYAPAAWHSAGTVLDTSYEALDAMARSPKPVPARPQGEGVEEPASRCEPARDLIAAPIAGQSFGPSAGAIVGPSDDATTATSTQPAANAIAAGLADAVAGRDVWLVHPWALGAPPADLPADVLCLGWWPAGHHDAWPWSPARWAFVGPRMAALAAWRWHGSGADLERLLAAARSASTWADPHVAPWLPPRVRQRPLPRLFPPVDRPCPSFSTWWSRATRGVRQLHELPGLHLGGQVLLFA